MNEGQLTTNQALIWYGLGGAVAFLGWFNIIWIYLGMGILFFIAILLTFFGG